MPGPATDVQFRTAAEELRTVAADLERATRCWPSADPALYGQSAASVTSTDRLSEAGATLSSVVAGLRVDADACDLYAYGCNAYYEAYRRYRAELAAYVSAWQAYDVLHQAWAATSTPIVLGPPVPGLPTIAVLTPVLPEPPMPTITRPSEPPCPPYCDPSPVR